MLTISGHEVRTGSRLGRRALHEELGGQRQGGISTPRDRALVLLFTGAGGAEFGYSDGWADRGVVFRYFGEGQRGNMAWVRGNRAVRNHAALGKELHLFEAVGDGTVEYLGEMDCGGWEFVENVPDLDGQSRRAIVFHLVRHGSEAQAGGGDEEGLGLQDQSLAALRALALEEPMRTRDPKQATRNVYLRSRAVAEYVLKRSGGTCEGCESVAPFVTKGGRPYLECHHTTRVSDGGPDHPAHVVAVCPNCHRRAHLGRDAEAFNGRLIQKATQAER